MPKQPESWAERTVEAPPAPQPWAEQTVKLPPQPKGFHRGVAQVAPRPQPQVEEVDPVEEPIAWSVSAPYRPLSARLADLRRGSEWSSAGALFAFVCWGIWAISARGNLTTPVLVFVLSMLVAVGLFALCRLIGRIVLERHLGRVRRTAVGAHLVTAAFLVAAGITYLRQTEWIVNAWTWLSNLD
ncbi:MAG: hypothetical protein DIU79_10030 [Actinobacteria bacterium]|jgi:hypothetical protein|nr:MAG: hypothetical protein DIU79_10030 [Actinomycetota bacterium]